MIRHGCVNLGYPEEIYLTYKCLSQVLKSLEAHGYGDLGKEVKTELLCLPVWADEEEDVFLGEEKLGTPARIHEIFSLGEALVTKIKERGVSIAPFTL